MLLTGASLCCIRRDYPAQAALIDREPPKTKVALNIPACSSTQVTPGYDTERHLTREKHEHTHSACLGTADAPAA